MYILGIFGSPTLAHEDSAARGWPFDTLHDASAVLLRNGEVVAGVAQERMDRVKYSNAFPIEAIRFCLTHAGVSLADVSYIAFPSDETAFDDLIIQNRRDVVRDKNLPLTGSGWTGRSVIQDLLQEAFGVEIPSEKIVFVRHHHAHAMSAFGHAGFDEALIYVRDGWGDELSGIVALGRNGALELLQERPMAYSLGHFYLTGTQALGYHIGDEYKVMGLAPYGDAERYRPLLDPYITHTDEGATIDRPGAWRVMTSALGGVRGRNAPFEKKHQDAAATFQRTLEDIAFKELRHWKVKTGQKNICLAGGVAQNCTLNGRIRASGIFDKVFAPAAPGDGGLALGAALSVHHEHRDQRAPRPRLRGVSWGSDISDPAEIEAALRPWADLIRYERTQDIVARSAQALADGKVIAWVRGRAEFGPRALGHRSILADPRPSENRERINAIVKKRESFRPFAPSVIDEAVTTFFDVECHDGEFAFMTFVVMVREQYRDVLCAITHVDGSARIQSVSRTENPAYWALISAFGSATGVPIVLNTSFNNNAEPIVETAEDAIVCFLTTDLDAMAMGDYWIVRNRAGSSICEGLAPSLSLDCVLEYERDPQRGPQYVIKSRRRHSRRAAIDAHLFDLLSHPTPSPCNDGETAERLYPLWCQRLIRMRPAELART